MCTGHGVTLSSMEWSRDMAGAAVSRLARYSHHVCGTITRWKDAVRRHVVRRCTLSAVPTRHARRMVRVSRARRSHPQGNMSIVRRCARTLTNTKKGIGIQIGKKRRRLIKPHNVLLLIISRVAKGRRLS